MVKVKVKYYTCKVLFSTDTAYYTHNKIIYLYINYVL